MGILEAWSLFAYAERRPTAVKVPKEAWTIIQKTVRKAKRTTNESLLPKVAHRNSDGGWRFRNDPPVLTPVDDGTRRKVVASLAEYGQQLPAAYLAMLRRYHVADVAHRVVGVGSVGTRAYLVLCFGNGDTDPLFLQVKEAIVPVHAAYLPPLQARKEHDHQGRRVIDTQRLLQALGDPLLGATTIDGRPYFVRQMKNMKASMPVSLMKGEPFDFWAFTCGALLARAHARFGDAIRTSGYCGDDDTLVTRRFIRAAHRAGKPVYVWTVDDPSRMIRMIGLGVDGLITNRPGVAREVVERYVRMSQAERLLLFIMTSLGAEEDVTPPDEELRY
jgi:Uncharacterized protein conserved in bacteria (DUF2252)/Glycerophosphoryl diester phosphodiesterase family